MQKKQTNNLRIQKTNRSNIYQLLYNNRGLTRREILQTLQISLPTVTQNIFDLEAEGLICESGSLGNTGGRRAKTYTIVKDAKTAIGLDITKNQVIAVAVDLYGNIIAQKKFNKEFECSNDYYKFIASVIDSVISESELNKNKILGVGIGVPGLVTPDNQTVFYGEILGFTGTTCSEIANYIPYKAILLNDANAAGFAEYWIRKELDNSFYIMLSNNVGGSVLINNQTYVGNHIHSGEVGHITIVPDGKPCYCGQKGCVDAYCAATVLSSITSGDLNLFFKLVEEKDYNALRLWDDYLDSLSLTINNLQLLFDCKIILGGYVGEFMGKYISEIKDRASKLNPFEKNADYIDVCQYKTNAIAAGAALGYISDYIESI